MGRIYACVSPMMCSMLSRCCHVLWCALVHIVLYIIIMRIPSLALLLKNHLTPGMFIVVRLDPRLLRADVMPENAWYKGWRVHTWSAVLRVTIIKFGTVSAWDSWKCMVCSV